MNLGPCRPSIRPDALLQPSRTLPLPLDPSSPASSPSASAHASVLDSPPSLRALPRLLPSRASACLQSTVVSIRLSSLYSYPRRFPNLSIAAACLFPFSASMPYESAAALYRLICRVALAALRPSFLFFAIPTSRSFASSCMHASPSASDFCLLRPSFTGRCFP